MMVDITNKSKYWRFFESFGLLKRADNRERNTKQNTNLQNTEKKLEPIPIVLETFNTIDVPGISFL